jgi:hypothetical protein
MALLRQDKYEYKKQDTYVPPKRNEYQARLDEIVKQKGCLD